MSQGCRQLHKTNVIFMEETQVLFLSNLTITKLTLTNHLEFEKRFSDF